MAKVIHPDRVVYPCPLSGPFERFVDSSHGLGIIGDDILASALGTFSFETLQEGRFYRNHPELVGLSPEDADLPFHKSQRLST